MGVVQLVFDPQSNTADPADDVVKPPDKCLEEFSDCQEDDMHESHLGLCMSISAMYS